MQVAEVKKAADSSTRNNEVSYAGPGAAAKSVANTPATVVINGSLEVPEEERDPILSFVEWKERRVREAQERADSTSQEAQKKRLSFNVDVANQLNVEDYFSMYLRTLDPSSFSVAAGRLSQQEVAVLLAAYRKQLDRSPRVKFSKSPKISSKSK